MNVADTHLQHHQEPRADLIRSVGRRDTALRFAEAREAERRSFLARSWARRFGVVGSPAPAAGS